MARRTASVVTTTPVTLAYLGRYEFEQLLNDSPEFATAFHSAIASRAAKPEDDLDSTTS